MKVIHRVETGGHKLVGPLNRGGYPVLSQPTYVDHEFDVETTYDTLDGSRL